MVIKVESVASALKIKMTERLRLAHQLAARLRFDIGLAIYAATPHRGLPCRYLEGLAQ
jgi:hypothetical protein